MAVGASSCMRQNGKVIGRRWRIWLQRKKDMSSLKPRRGKDGIIMETFLGREVGRSKELICGGLYFPN